jgi:hypothetical protein
MDRRIIAALYVVAMAAVIVGVDFAFFRNRFWERLMVNIGIVLVFAAFYFRFLMPPWSQPPMGHDLSHMVDFEPRNAGPGRRGESER